MIRKVYRFLASIKLAVVLLLALAVILGTATFYESLYDTKTAQYLVYGSPWFALFLATLFINVLCATTIRYPWKGYQTGFVITHVGILTILVGSMVTMVYGIDGQMAIEEGASSERVTLDAPVLLFGTESSSLKEIPAEFRWSPPREDRPYRYELGNGITAVVDGYYHHSLAEPVYRAAPGGEPAVKIEFTSSRFGALDNWLTPSMGVVTLGPASARLQTLAEGEPPPAATPDQGEFGDLQILVDEQPFLLPVKPLLKSSRRLQGTPYSVRVIRYLPMAVVRDNKLVNGGEQPRNPCVELEISNAKGEKERFYLFSNLPNLNTKFQQTGPDFRVRALYNFSPEHEMAEDGHAHQQKAPKRHLDLYLTPAGKLFYQLENGKRGEFVPGQPVSPGWMDIKLTLREVLPSSSKETVYREFKLPKDQKDGPPPAIRVKLEGSQKTDPFWLQYGDVREIKDASGKPAWFGYAFKTVPVGVKLELLDFEIGYDPGTTNPASYKSKVRVDGKEHTIQMNEPLHRNNFTFFQSSYQENPGGPWISVFSVAYDPGIFLKYLGSIMLVGGIFTMFYLKPYMQGKRKYQARQAAKESS